ncbi:Wzt carbohydrate-binding domain-containing protein [Opitutaceae bacterium]|nr:Wzt carbohydrate-binding domain-containing protein [Opitutaceae bacterium]
MSDPVIEVIDVGKAFRIWDTPGSRLTTVFWQYASRLFPVDTRLSTYLKGKSVKCYRDFHAIKGVDFVVNRGESVGIVGRNGSGKSTLLQIIAGTLKPTTGTVRVSGKVAALLELGSGFNPEFTGRENVYLNAAVLGLSREETDDRLNEIMEFAEIGDFIDQPVKTYSSGMVVRLAFAVAAHVDAEILIIDEALAVGDARFQLKCARAIDRFVSNGATLLFVSHDTSSVKRLCKHGVLLEKGNMVYRGVPNDVINLYSKLLADGGSLEGIQADVQALEADSTGSRAPRSSSLNGPEQNSDLETAASLPPSDGPRSTPLSENQVLQLRVKALEAMLESQSGGLEFKKQVDRLLTDERDRVGVSGREFSYGGELGRILAFDVIDHDNQSRTWFKSGESVAVRIEVQALEVLSEPIFALTIKNSAGVEVYGTNTLFSNQPSKPMLSGEMREVTFSFPANLMPGSYFLSFGFTQFVGDELLVLHRRYDAVLMKILPVDHSFGIANLHAKIVEKRLEFNEKNNDSVPP